MHRMPQDWLLVLKPPNQRSLESVSEQQDHTSIVLQLQDGSTDDEESELADTLEDVAIHLSDLPNAAPNNDEDDKIDFHTHIATIDDMHEPSSFLATLQTISVNHTLTRTVPSRNSEIFEGIMVDTGAARGSTSGRTQYMAYCNATGRLPVMDETRAAT